jgi:hypothetical protein
MRRRGTGKTSFWRVVWSPLFWIGFVGVGSVTAFLTHEMARSDAMIRNQRAAAAVVGAIDAVEAPGSASRKSAIANQAIRRRNGSGGLLIHALPLAP